MKKIINGRLYDTHTAKRVGYYSNYSEDTDFNAFEESLYKKKNGEFFLFGWGGAATIYREELGQNRWGSGSSIRPLSIQEAKEWAEDHLDGDEYIEIFGDVEE